jgi:RNA polymerase sigma factor (sigma-70 family)
VTLVNEHLARMDPLIRLMAAERVRPGLRDDAAQEARIAVWQAIEAHGDDPRPLDGLLTVVARRAVLDVTRGRRFTGEPSTQGRKEPLTAANTESLDPADEGDEVADHAAEIDLREAVAAVLEGLQSWERAYVTEHYMKDRPQAEVARSLGMSVGGLSTAWSRRLRPALATALVGALA